MVETGGPAASDGTAPGGGPAGQVEVRAEALEGFIRDRLVPARERMARARSEFGAMPVLQQELFGPIATALELTNTHRDGYDIYAPTMEALEKDLALLIDKLRQVIKNYSAQDDNVAEAMTRLAKKLSGEDGFQANTVYADARQGEVSEDVGAAPPRPEPAESAPTHDREF